jgi:hypothetical protein
VSGALIAGRFKTNATWRSCGGDLEEEALLSLPSLLALDPLETDEVTVEPVP